MALGSLYVSGKVPGYIHKKICTRILIAAICNRKIGNIRITGGRIGKLHVRIKKCYTAVKMNGLEFHMTAGIYLKS